jgi:hypothetical protein
MTITDKKIDEMNLFKVKLKKKELDLLVKHGRELIEENLESIQRVLKQTEQNRPGSSKR